MAKVIRIRRSSKGFPAYICGKILPLVDCDGKGVLAEMILSDARDLYPQLRINLKTLTEALDRLCENDLAKREYKAISGKSDEKVCHYMLTSMGITILALYSDQPDLRFEVVD